MFFKLISIYENDINFKIYFFDFYIFYQLSHIVLIWLCYMIFILIFLIILYMFICYIFFIFLALSFPLAFDLYSIYFLNYSALLWRSSYHMLENKKPLELTLEEAYILNKLGYTVTVENGTVQINKEEE